MRLKHLFPILLLLSLLVSGCQIFPYAYSTESPQLTESPEALTPEAEPTLRLPVPTATLTALPTEEAAQLIEPSENEAEIPAVSPTPFAPVYMVQGGNPIYLANFAHPSAGCGWTGVAGQVFDAEDKPQTDLLIYAGSNLTGDESQWAGRTGLSTAYGPGGYEIQLLADVQDTTGAFWVQVISPTGELLSERVYFDTFQECEQNLVLINFIPYDPNQVNAEAIPAGPTPKELTPTVEAYP